MWRKVWLAVILALVVLSIWLGLKSQRNSPYQQVQQELMRLQQMGEPTKLSDLLPPVPANQDGTAFYKLAIAQLEAAERKLPRQVWDSVYEFTSRKPTKPINLADVQKALQAANPALQTLREALKHPHMRMTDWDIRLLASLPFCFDTAIINPNPKSMERGENDHAQLGKSKKLPYHLPSPYRYFPSSL